MKEGELFFSWSEPLDKKETSKDWLWALIVIAIFGAATAFILKNFLFGVFILLAALVLYLFSKQDQDADDIKINSVGITKEGILYPYRTIQGFWIELHHEGGPELLIQSSRAFFPVVAMRLSEEIDIEDLHDFLSNILEERELREPKLYRILDRIGL